ncbi:unnamed protein product [Protopolystoma xenopodis]|uniref:Uncharacterized protein n=1 Tax=Protopolystoma xenopodis TaxID=117903 RepID=A0A3S5BS50_9PLAT|nr:unnamed protein product [Protopolystoma xenopodis]
MTYIQQPKAAESSTTPATLSASSAPSFTSSGATSTTTLPLTVTHSIWPSRNVPTRSKSMRLRFSLLSRFDATLYSGLSSTSPLNSTPVADTTTSPSTSASFASSQFLPTTPSVVGT